LRIIRKNGRTIARKENAMPATPLTHDRRLAQLFAPAALRQQSALAARAVVALRVLALCGPADRDPLLELSRRFSSIPAARAFLALADALGAAWPVSVMVMRPCCPELSPDEATLAAMIDAAASADRAALARALAGLVRADRHERLFDAAVEFAALCPRSLP
jgi:hypothetical protein